MQLYAHHAQPVPLRVEETGKDVDVFACATEDKKSVVIFAVNSTTEPVEWSYQFDGFGESVHVAKGEIVGDTLDARQTDVVNHWNAPERIKTMFLSLSLELGKMTLPALSVSAIEFETR